MILHVRPEELDLDLESEEKPFSVYAVQPQGSETLLHLKYGGAEPRLQDDLLVRSTNSEAASLAYGQRVALSVQRGNLYSYETKLLVTSFGGPVGATADRSQTISR
jgi:hypothetical protein